MSAIAIDYRDNQKWDDLAKQFDCTAHEVKNVSLLFTLRGARGEYEDEIKALDSGPYSNEINQWFDDKFREILVEIRAM